MNILESLNNEQKEAVLHTEGPLLILAGAGSGKTKTLTHRVAHLIYDKNIVAGSILAVTFTNKSAEEMRLRIARLLQKTDFKDSNFSNFPLYSPVIGTFHSVCSKILRQEIKILGRESGFRIIDTSEQISLIKKIIKEIDLDPKQFSPKGFLSLISSAKNRFLDVSSFSTQAQGYFEEITAKVYDLYEKALWENGVLDFDDLLVMSVKIFQDYPSILEKYQQKFRYVLVDEYQDTNNVQYQLITMLTAKHRNLCVVGDDWQSIYAFRGADIRNILEFEKDYPDAKVIHLEQNYRSTQNILDAAHGIISQNVHRKEKKLWTQEGSGEKIVVYEAQDEVQEAKYVAKTITTLVNEKKLTYKDFAILYRTNAQSRALEEAFLAQSIPYKIIGGMKFYERKEIKDIISYIRFISCLTDQIALERIINEPKRGIGKKTFLAWRNYADFLEKNMLEAGKVIKESSLKMSKKESISYFCQWVEEMIQSKKKKTFSLWVEMIYKTSSYERIFEALTPSEREVKRENIQEFLGSLKKYDDIPLKKAISLFLEEIALLSDSDAVDRQGNMIHCMTLHSAKGLEFPYVFIVGMEENILPHSRAFLFVSDLEEERRLMYVGVTRAKKCAYLTYAKHRMLFGSMQANPPSRFLGEIPEELLHRSEEEYTFEENTFSFEKTGVFLKRNREKKQQKRENFVDGERVEHTSFGEGIVVSQNEELYVIVFQKVGIKKISKTSDVFLGKKFKKH
jgi:DNA helicase II / ATP-dependent DNA helicase PcrA